MDVSWHYLRTPCGDYADHSPHTQDPLAAYSAANNARIAAQEKKAARLTRGL
jgi:hypothetical protein